MAINADKPKLWKSDVERSIDFYNDWFLRFAPETYRKQRSRTTKTVADALKQTTYLREITSEILREQPGRLSILRMVCAPPLARDRLVGLAQVNKNLVMTMEGKPGKPPRIPPRMEADELTEQLQRICETVTELADRDLFPWLGTQNKPSKSAITRAATVIASPVTTLSILRTSAVGEAKKRTTSATGTTRRTIRRRRNATAVAIPAPNMPTRPPAE